ncbi:MAG TPA: rhodanese-like domain-containing protein [Pyrinomonadaceae bacterium]|jgi:rhodanese-related sulfurtransferase
MAEVQTITTEELQRQLNQGGDFHFWNVLTDEYFHGEMIPGSHRVPLDRIGREVAQSKLAKDAEIVTYCAGPKCPQSMLAAQKLVELGYTNVKAYEGGLEEWQGAGHEIERVGQAATA